jgi:effector-binding domain-containing protein
MKIIKVILVVLVLLAAGITIAGLLSPSLVHVERSITIKAPYETVHEQVNILKNWKNWSPWYKKDTAAKITYNETEAGAGAGFTWESKNSQVGNGTMTIISSNDDSICLAIQFGNRGPSTAKFVLTRSDSSTKVAWIMENDMGMNPVGRLVGLFMDKMIGPDFENGLANLKAYAEAIPVKPAYKFNIMEEEAEERVYIIKKDSISLDSIPDFFARNLSLILEAVKKAKLEMTGAPSGLYFKWDEDTRSTEMAAAIPVKGNLKTKVKGFDTYIVPAGKNLHIAYIGGYAGIGSAHMEMDAYMKEKNLLQGIPMIEEYVTDPGNEPDSTRWLTNIYYPVK